MPLTPFRFDNYDNSTLLTNELGDFGVFDSDIVSRILSGQVSHVERSRLERLAIIVPNSNSWQLHALYNRLKRKVRTRANSKSYFIVVPTLRCNLRCTYCQVSRANEDAVGFDWSEETVERFLQYLDQTADEAPKVEFQGGEPALRLDLLERIMDGALKIRSQAEFVICTNLLVAPEKICDLVDRYPLTISTSIDGPEETTTQNRTQAPELTTRFFENFSAISSRVGPNKISALTTITPEKMDEPTELIDFYVKLGLKSVFLRPVNFMGFARKAHERSDDVVDRWEAYYRKAIDYLIEVNGDIYVEEYYLSMVLRKMFSTAADNYVDFRSPIDYANEFIVIDFDETLFPSDEARMLYRTGTVDLSLGSLRDALSAEGKVHSTLDNLNLAGINQVHPDCLHCAYMPFCGIDPIDEISRYGRGDVPKHDTWFCQRNMLVFRMIFERIIDQDRAALRVFWNWINRRLMTSTPYEVFHDKADLSM